MTKPVTLGAKFASAGPAAPLLNRRDRIKYTIFTILHGILLICIAYLAMWWVFFDNDVSVYTVWAMMGVLTLMWIYNELRRRSIKRKSERSATKEDNFLLVNDRQKFMYDLQLDAKTAVLDGSNIYHFGHEHELDAQPLGGIAFQLRNEGYRIVCFFDANIFYTLQEHGAFDKHQRHSTQLLSEVFGLQQNEIYVVPSGVQADIYVLETMKHLNDAFAVTNDQFRDYAKKYPTVMKGQWRRGIQLSKGQIKLLQHKLKAPIVMS